MIDRYTEQRIKAAADIVEVLRYYGFNLKRSGARYVTLCPFHADRDPSLCVGGKSRYANTCHCYVCEAHYDPIEFIREYDGVGYYDALRRLAQIEGVPIVEGEVHPDRPLPPPRKPKPLPPPDYMSHDLVSRSMQYANNPLFAFASALFGHEAAYTAFTRYIVGTSKVRVNPNQGERRSVVFWQTDEHGNVRAGKIMPYNEQTGKRIKMKGGREVTWAHSELKMANYNLCQCLFGQHLITAERSRINIVESEKTAILASLYFGESKGTWIATGGKTAGRAPIIAAAPLMEGKQVVLYPDADSFKDWQSLCDMLNDIGVEATVSSAMKGISPGTKFDIGDFIVSVLTKDSGMPPHRETAARSANIDTPRQTSEPPTAPTPPPPTSPAPPPRWEPESTPPYPIAPGETQEQARERNAAILNQGLFVVNLLSEVMRYRDPTPREIEILNPDIPPPQYAPF